MSNQDKTMLSASALRDGFARGLWTAREVVDEVLDRASRFPQVNAFATLAPDRARAEADVLDRQRRDGGTAPALAAVPFSVKDLIATRGVVTAHASVTMRDNVPAQDASPVAQLCAAGGTMFAKTTTPEFGHKVLTDSPLHGITRNPWNLERTCGGSSGGAAVAVALGIGPIAVTTDGAGSGRIPASCCGIYGLKGTLGRVPNELASDVFGLMVYIGIMARHPADLALGLAAMSAPDIGDPWTIGVGRAFDAASVPTSGLVGRRFTVVRRTASGYLHPDVEARLDAAIAFLDRAGAIVREVDGMEIDWKYDAARNVLRANQLARYDRLVRERAGDLDPSFVHIIEEGRQLRIETFGRYLLDRTALYRTVDGLMADGSLLLTPTLAAPPPPVDQYAHAPLVVGGEEKGELRAAWYNYTIPFNLTGHPAISIPFGHGRDGLPVGLQVVGPWFSEADLITVAQAFDMESGASGIVPPMATAS
jgi:aspartyl-tRNA(Asn)/glutamyl-tRNA(Gln) amidotransferase subunit A